LLFAQLPAYLAEMALFAVNTGLRAQELCGLKWEWEYTLSGTTHTVFVLPEEVTKNGKERIVPLNAAARSVIETRRPRGGEYVFGTNDTKLSRPTNRAWNKARKLTGIDARWHDLRHTFGSRLRSAGVNEEDRADLLGHHKGSITTHYSQAQIQHLIACVEKLCETDTQKPEMTLIKRKK
jgi:integrase